MHLPDIFLMPGIAGKVDGSALAAVGFGLSARPTPTTTPITSWWTALASAADALYAAMDAYAGSVNGIAILEVPGSTVDNAFAFATENKDRNTLLVGNPMKFTHGPPDFASPVGPIVGGILERELDP